MDSCHDSRSNDTFTNEHHDSVGMNLDVNYESDDDSENRSNSDHSSEWSSSSSVDDDVSSGGSSDGDDYPLQHETDGDEHMIGDAITDDNDIEQLHKRSARNRMIVLALSTLLTILLINFGYQLFRLSQMPSSVNDEEITSSQHEHHPAKNNVNDNDQKAASASYQEQKVNAKERGTTKRQSLQDHTDYKMPHYPTRIYTHASLSSRNYRAGGVLSDEMLERFEEDGVIVIRNLVSPKLLDRLDIASQMLIDGQDKVSTRKKRGKQFHMVKNGAVFLGIPPPENGSKTCTDTEEGSGVCEEKVDTTTTSEGKPEDKDGSDDDVILSSFRDLAMYSKIPRVAASLLRLDELRVGGEEYLKPDSKRRRRHQQHKDQDPQNENEAGEYTDDSINLRICRDIFLTKDDDSYACGWHVDDTGFWPSIASDPGVNAWVALDDFPAPAKSGKKPSDDGSYSKSTPVATFALSLGSHRSSWRHEAYEVTGSTHTIPPEGFQSAIDLIQRRKGSGTCNIQTSAPHLYENLEKNKVIYDLKRGDVIFHDRWLFHRTVTVDEYNQMANDNSNDDANKKQQPTDEGKIFRRYSIRYSPGSATVPPGYGVEPSVLHDYNNANSTLDEIVERSGPWYPKVWPHVLKRKPIVQSSSSGTSQSDEEEEIEGITELVHDKMPKAEELQKKRKKEIQRLLNMRGGL